MDLFQNPVWVSAYPVGLIEEENDGDVLLGHSGKQNFRLGLDTLHGADYQNSSVQRPQGTLHLGGEVHMAWGIDKVDLHIFMAETDAGGFHRNAPAALHRQSVGVGGAGVHTALGADGAGVGQKLFG